MEQSILTSTKKVLHIAPDDDSFDLDVMTHINSAFSTLTDLGVGPANGFVIEDTTPVWDDVIPSTDKVQHNRVKAFVFLHTRLAFDPPAVSYLLEAAQKQLEEVTWRLNVNREEVDWVDPTPPDVLVVDGGDPSGVI